MMKAVEISQFGPAEVLTPTTRSIPAPKDGEVLIRVRAAGVNRPDLLQRMGKYPPPPGASDLPGLEVAGEIIESRHPHWKEGMRVCALLSGGGYAEYAVAHGGQCLPTPDQMSDVEAAALPETIFTVWNNVFVRGQLKNGERLLVHGGASGIGTTAIQMAKALGAQVAITAGSDDKCESCRALGADLAVNYRTQDFKDAIEAAWGITPLNVVLDMVGGDYVARNIALLATDGRHVSIAQIGGAQATVNLREIMQKRIILTGSTLRPRSVEEKTMLADGILKHIWPYVKNGTIKPQIFKTFPLDDAALAHKALEAGDHVGKIVLVT